MVHKSECNNVHANKRNLKGTALVSSTLPMLAENLLTSVVLNYSGENNNPSFSGDVKRNILGTVEIYYFSGTGNSLAVARDIAESLNAALIPVASVMDQEEIQSEAGVIGIVFPLYDFKPPLIVENFVRKIKNINAHYVFAVCTYGITPFRSLKHLNKVIESCGGHLSAGFAVGMPHNGIGSGAVTKAQQKKCFENWKNNLQEVCDYIRTGKEGKIESSSLFSFFQPRIIKMVPSLLKFLKQLLLKGSKSLAFTAGESCDGCGICEKICPVHNIEVVDTPVWSDHCASCFACLHWCPKEAITLGNYDLNIRIYHHPRIKISDMLKVT